MSGREWRVVLTFDTIRSADPRRSVAHLFEPARAYPTRTTRPVSLCGISAAIGDTDSRLVFSDRRCRRCEKKSGIVTVKPEVGAEFP